MRRPPKPPITKKTAKPIVFGHRGSAGYRPEHTLAAYELGARMGADYIEPDLVSTKDNVLVCRHEPNITDTTDVADHAEFADRKTTKTIDGVTQTGWFTTDFTYAELKTLRAKERLPAVRQRNTLYDRRYHVPTFQQVIDLSKKLSKELHRQVGIVPETKHPTFFRSLGPADIEQAAGQGAQQDRPQHADVEGRRAVVRDRQPQGAEQGAQGAAAAAHRLHRAARPTSDGKVTYDEMSTPDGPQGDRDVRRLGRPQQGPHRPAERRQDLGHADELHQGRPRGGACWSGPFTFRNENQFMAAEFRRGDPADPNFPNLYGNAFAEYAQFFNLGVDGLFSDNPDTAIAARGH